jgi:hypothetical protein
MTRLSFVLALIPMACTSSRDACITRALQDSTVHTVASDHNITPRTLAEQMCNFDAVRECYEDPQCRN